MTTRQMGSTDLDNADQRDVTVSGTRPELKRNLAAYWLLGLCNNYAYVIMLSAAHDILSQDFQGNTTTPSSGTTIPASNSSRDCNPVSTGTILLADIIPSLVMKLTVPFILSHTRIRVICVIVLSSLSFLFVALSQTRWQAFIGVICAATSGGLGEVTFLQYSAKYHKNVVSTWSSGTGGSGMFGALSYAALTSAGITPRKTVLLMLVVPAVMAVTFFLLLDHNHKSKCLRKDSNGDGAPLLGSGEETRSRRLSMRDTLTLRAKFKIVPKLTKFMVPLGLVYFFEYFINQGLFELIYIRGIWLNHHSQYRWFQVDYQLGVFISRSSVNCFKVKAIWVLAVFQFVNMLLLFTEALYLYMPSVWIVFLVILWEGLVAGSAYVNTFYGISHEVIEEDRAFAMGIASLASSIGISVAGFLSVPTHHWLCSLP